MKDDVRALAEVVAAGDVVVLSGAGMSTGSGIPDYRGPTGMARATTPMTFQTFIGSAEARQRYWARSHLGWPFIARAQPNAGHQTVARLQRAGLVTGLITQNVDGLHQAAGAVDVLELHGSLNRVACLACGAASSRLELHDRLAAANPGWVRAEPSLMPDGDVDLADVVGFVVVNCLACDGLLKPDVVYFGETVPRGRVDRSFTMVSTARTLLVLGSSLKVMSGYRFVLHGKRQGIRVAIVNQGMTRGDAQADVRVDAELSGTLSELVATVATSAA